MLPARPRFSLFFFVSLAIGSTLGCAASVKTALGPNSSHVITCGNGMSACVAKADKICGDDGYTILEGTKRNKILGGSSSAYRTRSEIGEITVRCGVEENEEEAPPIVYKLPERTDAPVVVEEPIVPTAGAVCTPGSTLACVGPGACQGGQVCLENGLGYGPCDCGPAGPKMPASERANGPSTVDGGSSTPPTGPVVPGVAPTPTPLGQQK